MIKQFGGDYNYSSESLVAYQELALQLLDQFDDFKLSHVPISGNKEANAMAQAVSGLILLNGVFRKTFSVEKGMVSFALTEICRSLMP